MTASALAQSPLIARRERLWPLVFVSLCAHGAAIALAVLHEPTPRLDLEQKPIVAKLVRLGEKRPQHFLPRKEPAAAPAPAAAEPVSIPAPAEKPQPAAPPPAPAAKPKLAAPAPAPKATAPKANGKRDVLASVLSRVKRETALSEPVYGDPEGDPLGDASEASAGDQYLALVERSLRESYVLPSTISEQDRMHLKATVVLYLDADGQVLRFAFESKSGNGAFDAALERAIRAARIPPPPTELRKKYRDEGLGVVYRP
jgi:colicin import membrane protein/protein TonB